MKPEVCILGCDVMSQSMILTVDDYEQLRECLDSETFEDIIICDDGKLCWESSGYHVTENQIHRR